MMVWHPFPSEVSGQFMGTTSGNKGGITGSGGSTTSFSTFLFYTFGTGVRMTSGDLDLLRKL